MISLYGYGERLDPVPALVVGRLRQIDRRAGEAGRYRSQFPTLLDELRSRAQIESVEASSAIEGVTAPKPRVVALAGDNPPTPVNRSEQELLGYRNALTYVFGRVAADERISWGLIMHLHRLLYAPTGALGAGRIKTLDNAVVERDELGVRRLRFTPVSAAETETQLDALLSTYHEALRRDQHHPLLLTAAMILDFTIIHPFADSNGRVSRLLTNLAIAKSGYDVGKYISIEKLYEGSQEQYYAALAQSTTGWEEGSQEIWPWVNYFVEQVETAYEKFVGYAEIERSYGNKGERVRRYVVEHADQGVELEELRLALPGVADRTMRRVLRQMRDQGLIAPTSAGRNAKWMSVGELVIGKGDGGEGLGID